MRIIEDVKDEKRCKCPNCGCLIGYNENDDIYPMSGGYGIICPNCQEDIIVEDGCPYEFPKGFYHFGNNKGSLHIGNDEINKWVKEGLQKMKKNRYNDNGDLWYCGTGDTEVWMCRADEDSVCVTVAQNYYSTDVNYDWIE